MTLTEYIDIHTNPGESQCVFAPEQPFGPLVWSRLKADNHFLFTNFCIYTIFFLQADNNL